MGTGGGRFMRDMGENAEMAQLPPTLLRKNLSPLRNKALIECDYGEENGERRPRRSPTGGRRRILIRVGVRKGQWWWAR